VTGGVPALTDLPAPGMARRLACLVYEALLLFGVVMGAGLLYGLATNQRHALEGTLGLQIAVFLVLGLYFVWFWVRHGQTLAMRTWQLKLVTVQGRPLGLARAAARYVLCWVWVLPALAALQLSGMTGSGRTFLALCAGVLVYAASAYPRRDRQFWHDALCGTRIVAAPHPAKTVISQTA
jgi:uncharacterized RDD family membrane protein YckC